MSLSLVGVWHVGVWNQTVWGYGVWREGNPEAEGGGTGRIGGRRRRLRPPPGTVDRDSYDRAEQFVRKIEDEAREATRKQALSEREIARRREAVLRARAAQPEPETIKAEPFVPALAMPEIPGVGEALSKGQAKLMEEEALLLLLLSA